MPVDVSTLPAPQSDTQAQLRRLQVENQYLLAYLDRIESLWVNLQKRSDPGLLPIDLPATLLAAIPHIFPVVLSAVYRVDAETHEFTLEQCVPPGLQEDLQDETQRQIAQGNFALALRRSRPTACASLGLHRYHPRVRTVVLVPLVTLQEVHGMALVAIERVEQDIGLHELKLLSILTGQMALALESAQLEAELKKAQETNERLTVVDRTRESLLATVSHELRTPLSAILGSLDLIRQEWSERLPPEGQKLIEICQRNSTMLLSLVSDLLDSAALHHKQMILHRSVIPFSPLVEQTFAALAPLAWANGVKLLNMVLPQIEVYADAQRLQQVLLNLVGNAIKFSKKEEAYVQVEATQEEEHVTVCVVDNGVGIAPEKIGRIFEPFVQGADSYTAPTTGTGLGLTICKALIERHGGSIRIESEPGRGSRVSFSLPCKAA